MTDVPNPGDQDQMGRPKSAPKTRHVKITQKAYEAATIASGFFGDSIVDFISRLIEEHAERIIDEQYRLRKERVAEAPPEPEPDEPGPEPARNKGRKKG